SPAQAHQRTKRRHEDGRKRAGARSTVRCGARRSRSRRSSSSRGARRRGPGCPRPPHRDQYAPRRGDRAHVPRAWRAHADLVQEGTIGVLRALESFDYRRGNRLATYATWWIRRSMLRAIADAATIPLPAEARRELAAILR